MINETDSFSEYVRGRITNFNPARQVLGVIDATDWPPQKVSFESFYCLLKGMRPERYGTIGAPAYGYLLQWTWLIAGTDLAGNVESASRGDRYRTHLTMCEELRQGLWPNFTEKLQWSVDGSGNLQSVSMSPQEFIHWQFGSFKHTLDKQSGLLYGFCDVVVSSMTTLISS